ncbi:hypothetical protein ACHAW6_010154 [Cyclotella cf. meneghiniana]
MKRRRILFALTYSLCCAASEQAIAAHVPPPGPLSSWPRGSEVTTDRRQCRERQNAAFLFSMLKRRRERLEDTTSTSSSASQKLQEQLEPSLTIVNHPFHNGHEPFVNGAKKQPVIDAGKTLYFATPVNDGHSNHQASATGKPHKSISQEMPSTTVEPDDATNMATVNETTQNSTDSFKSSLLTGLELQTAAHRTRLLRDLLAGVKEGVMNAVDTEKEKMWFKEDIMNAVERKGSFWNFWRRRHTAAAVAAAPVGVKETRHTVANAVPIHSQYAYSPSAAATATIQNDNLEQIDSQQSSKFASRTITGLINALASEVENLEVQVNSDPTTPISNKTIHSIQIYFSRLGFKQLRMRGKGNNTAMLGSGEGKFSNEEQRITADEAFDRIDTDRSGGLDSNELASALKLAAVIGSGSNSSGYIGIRSKEILSEMASRLLRLYDKNLDGVVDREEYKSMVRDMAVLREARLLRDEESEGMLLEGGESAGMDTKRRGWFASFFPRDEENNATTVVDENNLETRGSGISGDVMDVTENEVFWSLVDQGEGSIVLEDLRLDLRRLLFGAIPVVKRILPGGPLILKPFTATVTASFNREDIMESFLIDAGLRRLVARALSRRVRGLRDMFDGAVFYGRTWKLFEQNAPLVEVPKLQDVQFDSRNRLIITGRARIKAAPDAPSIENGFKLRTKIGTRANGRIIGLLEPEIAVFAECPKAIETSVRKSVKDWFDYTIPNFKPLYAYIPLVSPLKKNDNMDGFNLGEDNQIKSIEIKNGKLCFEISAVLRPGRFLGNHYLAFTVPIRTLIITLDRVKEGMRTARRNKRLADKAARELKTLAKLRNDMAAACDNECAIDEVMAQSISGKSSIISNEGRDRLQRLEKELKYVEDKSESNENSHSEERKSFISRFVEGYSGAIREDEDLEINSRLSSSISNFFGSQDSDV